MRTYLSLWVTLLVVAAGLAQSKQDDIPPSRYGVIQNLAKYPQADPKQALASVLKAIEDQRVDYLLAHLADPEFVDDRVKQVYGGKFDELVRETKTKLTDYPASVKELERFAKEGEWQETKDSAVAKLKDVKERQVFMKKVGNRWYFENRQKAEESK
jgi:hypothetical protein